MKSVQVCVCVLCGLTLLLTPLAYAQVGGKVLQSDERIQALLEEKDIKYSVDSDGDFKVEFEMNGGRSQLAFILSKTNEYGNFEIREIQAYGYKAENGIFPPNVLKRLLEDSFTKKLGGWAIVDDYALFITRIAASSDAESLWNALIFTLEAADEMEKEFTGDRDEF